MLYDKLLAHYDIDELFLETGFITDKNIWLFLLSSFKQSQVFSGYATAVKRSMALVYAIRIRIKHEPLGIFCILCDILETEWPDPGQV